MELYMAYGFLSALNITMWYLLVAAAIIFCISSLDDCFFDIVYWLTRFKKAFLTRKKDKKIYYHELAALPEKKIAVMVPCWHEVDVIQQMLTSNISQIDYKNYDIYIGLYHNDPETLAAVERAKSEFKNIYYSINAKEGPTTKADNLDTVYNYIHKREAENNIKYDIFVLHDAEDIIHPLSFKLYNYAIQEFDMIQTPVLPLEVPLFNATHWIYNDEFAEMHLNSLLVRGYIRGLIPSAGVGTAFSRKSIDLLSESSLEKLPFSTHSVTEDYDASIRVQKLGLKATFFPFSVARILKKRTWFGLGPLVPKVKEQLIATRALFPTTYRAAVKQRTRWVFGITLQAWSDIGWPGSAAIRFTLFHDRKAILTHFFNGFGYFILAYWAISYITDGFYNYHLKTISDFLAENPWVYVLIVISTIFMIERIVNRAIFTGTIYGFWPAVLSVPRIIYANVLNIHTSYIAMKNFLMGPSRQKWIKTSHVFPSDEQLAMYRRKIGDIMLDEGLISTTQLKSVMTQQSHSGDKIGDIMLQHGYVNLKRLTELLAQQNNLGIVDAKEFTVLENNQIKDMPNFNYNWLMLNKVLPIKISGNTLTLAISDPSILNKRDDIQKTIAPYQTKFVLISLSQKLGDMLMEKGLVTPQQIAAVVADQVVSKEKLGTALVRKGYLKQEQLNIVLAEQYNISVIDMDKYSVLSARQLPKMSTATYRWCIDNKLIPIACDNHVVTLILPDPSDEPLKRMAITNLSPYDVKFVITSQETTV